jgi:hypothetical protein
MGRVYLFGRGRRMTWLHSAPENVTAVATNRNAASGPISGTLVARGHAVCSGRSTLLAVQPVPGPGHHNRTLRAASVWWSFLLATVGVTMLWALLRRPALMPLPNLSK